MNDREPFDCAPCEGVVKGTVVILADDRIVYAGPLKQAPPVDGKMLLLNAEDFDLLKTHVDRRKH